MANPLQTPNTTWPLIHPDLITTVSTTRTTTVIMEVEKLLGLTSLLFSRDSVSILYRKRFLVVLEPLRPKNIIESGFPQYKSQI
jgi:hypothetical protein